MHLLFPLEHDASPRLPAVPDHGEAGARPSGDRADLSNSTSASTDAALDAVRMHRLRLVGHVEESRRMADTDRTIPPHSLTNPADGSRFTGDTRSFTAGPPRSLAVTPSTAVNIRRLSAGRIPPERLSASPTALSTTASTADAGPAMGKPIREATDPRWVLAVRTAESLEGTVLRPEKRERLVHLGKILGLSPFDANLVIAIVQDQARRGFAPSHCPTAGEPQLRLVPLPHRELSEADARSRRILIISAIIAVLVGFELVILKWIFS